MSNIGLFIQQEREKFMKILSMKDWEEGTILACPKLRTHAMSGWCWMALDYEPCPTKECKMYGCHNYGRAFDQPKRLVIIDSAISKSKRTE